MSDFSNMSRNDKVSVFIATLIPYLQDAWGKDNSEISVILHKYNLLTYIDTSYEIYNTMGVSGVIEDLESFIEEQGGSI